MPPPVAQDAWLAARRFGVVIDAGSSGSRLQIYSWTDVRVAKGKQPLNSLPKVEKGTQHSEEWSMKVEPGISTFAHDPDGIAGYLAPLIEHARSHIPPSLHPETPIFLLATAGMRLLSPTQQADILTAVCHYLNAHSNFKIDGPSATGPCGSSVRIITGEEEGLFGWIAVNYLMDGFTGSGEHRLTYGFLDMGGASTQIAFEPNSKEQDKARNLIDVRLRLLDGQEVHHSVFVTTWLGYGTNQARERYVSAAVDNHQLHDPSATSSVAKPILDPCLPKGLRLTESPLPTDSSSGQSGSYTLLGAGSFEQCLQRTLPLLNKEAPCSDTSCLFNGVYVPPIDFAASHFIGISEYWYSSEHVFGLGGAYDVVQYERAASDFCARDWEDILQQHEQSRQQETPENESGGRHEGQAWWGPQVEIPRLQMQCFKAAWIANVLHEGIGMPRIVDPGGNGTTEGDNIAEQADRKGLGRPTFQSVESVGDIAISWTLGKMVLEASKEVPPLSGNAKPLMDPLYDEPNNLDGPIDHVRPHLFVFDAIEDKLSKHIPSPLRRESLGFSLLALLFYCACVLVFFAVAYRLRHRFRAILRRYAYKRDRSSALDDFSLEAGEVSSGGIRPSSPWSAKPTRFSFQLFRSLRAPSSRGTRPLQLQPITLKGQDQSGHQGQYSPTRVSPLRSFSYPVSKSQNGLSAPDVTNAAATALVPGSPRFSDGSIISNGSLSSLTSRSRNSSQMNLSSLSSRQMSSRTSSGSHTPIGSLFLEE